MFVLRIVDKVLVQATKLFLLSGAAEKMISGGKGLLQLATEIDSAKLPEDQIATYLYKLRGKFKINSKARKRQVEALDN